MKTNIYAACLAAALSLTTAASALAQAQKLIFAYPVPANSESAKFFDQWARKVEADSGNTVSIDVKYGTAIANFSNMIDRVENDVIQIGVTILSLFRGKFDLTQVVAVPFVVDLDDVDQASAALWRVYKTGLLDSEFQTIVPLFLSVSKQSGFHFAQPPKSIDQLNGLKIRIFSDVQVDMVKSFGMQPLSLPPQDMYVGLQRGTLDAVITSWSSFPPYKLQEVTKYHVELPLGGSVLMAFMARKKYDELPPQVRNAIAKNSEEFGSRAYGKVLANDADEARKVAGAQGNTITQLSSQKFAEWKQRIGNPMIENWKAANPSAPKVLDTFNKFYADVKEGR